MTEQEFIEQLADKEHASWARWMDYLFNRCDIERGKDGFRYVIPHELVERWKRQVDTPYAELSEQEKQSDRDEVAHILPIIREYKNTLDASKVSSLFEQAALAKELARLADHVQRLETEIFSTVLHSYGLDGNEKARYTLLGRVNELSGMAALKPVDQSFFIE